MFVSVLLLAALETLSQTAAIPLRDYGKAYPFRLEGHVAGRIGNRAFILADETNRLIIQTGWDVADEIHPGDRVRAIGQTIVDGGRRNSLWATNVTVLGHGPAPIPTAAAADRLVRGGYDLQPVVLRGLVTDLFHDDIDPHSNFLILSANGLSVAVVSVPSGRQSVGIGDEIEVCGVVDPHPGHWRIFQERAICLTPYNPNAIRLVKPAPSDPFAAPLLNAPHHVNPTELAQMGFRRTYGCVLATWHGDRMLIDTGNGFGSTVQVLLDDRSPLPRPGDTVEVVGMPETDLFTITLVHARWRPASNVSVACKRGNDKPMFLTAGELLSTTDGHRRVQAPYHGRLIQLQGVVRAIPTVDFVNSRMLLQCDEHVIPVDLSAVPSAADDIVPGCRIEVTGICLLLSESWTNRLRFPRLDGFAVIPRRPDDISVLARPPWWTPGRLLIVIGSLLAALVAIVIWNRLLRKMVERSQRKVLRTEIAKARSDLRVTERTRLAAELHDSIAQILTGVGFQIDAAAKTLDKRDTGACRRFLDIAKRTLLSCREELRRCLWDLRGHSLEEKDFESALRTMLYPLTEGAEVKVLFPVLRQHLSDMTAHDILCIVRELAVNAVRHGHARNVIVQGTETDGRIRFSVRDNGCGFDPAAHPGPAQGHFGLQGVHERVERHHGTLSVESSIGKGSAITVEIRQ